MKKTSLLPLILTLAIIAAVFAGCSNPAPDTHAAEDNDPISISAEDNDPAPAPVEEDNVSFPDPNLYDDRDYISILFVGNSFVFFGDVPGQLQTLAGAQGIEITYIDISRGGATLRDSRNNAIAEMQNAVFDYVVLQDQSRRPLFDTGRFLDDVQVLSDAARENGVIPVLFSPAVIEEAGDVELQNDLTEVYKQAADGIGAVLINAGGAWIHADQTIPGLVPHKDGNQAFIAACVFAATLFDLQITYIPQDNWYTSGDTEALAQAAWDFVNTQN